MALVTLCNFFTRSNKDFFPNNAYFHNYKMWKYVCSFTTKWRKTYKIHINLPIDLMLILNCEFYMLVLRGLTAQERHMLHYVYPNGIFFILSNFHAFLFLIIIYQCFVNIIRASINLLEWKTATYEFEFSQVGCSVFYVRLQLLQKHSIQCSLSRLDYCSKMFMY